MNVSFPKCNQAGTEFVISTTDDLQEKVNYLSEDFPVAIFTQTYHHAASDSTPFHWHNELQLNWVSEGELEYCINGDSLRLSGDKILLVKDHQLHSSRTTEKDTCSLCINFSPDIFHPMILYPAFPGKRKFHQFHPAFKSGPDQHFRKSFRSDQRTFGIFFHCKFSIPGI